MPEIFTNNYLMAVSQDIYNGYHLPDDYSRNPRTTLDICDIGVGPFSEADSSKMCGQGCGECYLITGPRGSQTYMVNEISDIPVVGLAQQGINMNIFSAHNGDVLSYQGPSAISMKKVPCPVSGTIKMGFKGYG